MYKFIWLLIISNSFLSACSFRDTREQAKLKWTVGKPGLGKRGHEYLTEFAITRANDLIYANVYTENSKFYPNDADVKAGKDSLNPIIRGNYLTDVPFSRKGEEIDLAKAFSVDSEEAWHTSNKTQNIHFLRTITLPSADKKSAKAQPKKQACYDARRQITNATQKARDHWNSDNKKALNYLGFATHIIQDSFSKAHTVRKGTNFRKITDICTFGTEVIDGCFHSIFSPVGEHHDILDDIPWDRQNCAVGGEFDCLKPEAQAAVAATTGFLFNFAQSIKDNSSNKQIESTLESFYEDSSFSFGAGMLSCDFLPAIGEVPSLASVSSSNELNSEVGGLDPRIFADTAAKNDSIPFSEIKAFKPGTNELLDPNDIVTPPLAAIGGAAKSFAASEFMLQVNSLEAWFNERGMSLKNDVEDMGTLTKTLKDGDLIGASQEIVNKYHKSIDLIRMSLPLTEEEIKKKFTKIVEDRAKAQIEKLYSASLESIKAEIPILAPIISPEALPKPNSELKSRLTRNWNFPLGEATKIGAELAANIRLAGDEKGAEAFGEGAVTTLLYNKRFDIANLVGKYSTPAKGNMNGELAFRFFGAIIYTKKHEGAAINISARENGGKWEKGVDNSVKYRMMIGPVPVSATIGAAGLAYYDWGLTLAPIKAMANMTPGADLKVYAQLAIDIEIATAGVEGNLILLKDNLELRAEAGLDIANLSDPVIYFTADSFNNLEALAGNIGAFVESYVPRFGVPPWQKKKWGHEIYAFSGYKTKSNLFNFRKRVSRRGVSMSGDMTPDDAAAVSNEDLEAKVVTEEANSYEAIMNDLNKNAPQVVRTSKIIEGQANSVTSILNEVNKRLQELGN